MGWISTKTALEACEGSPGEQQTLSLTLEPKRLVSFPTSGEGRAAHWAVRPLQMGRPPPGKLPHFCRNREPGGADRPPEAPGREQQRRRGRAETEWGRNG